MILLTHDQRLRLAELFIA